MTDYHQRVISQNNKACPRCGRQWPAGAKICTCGHQFTIQFGGTQQFQAQTMPVIQPVAPLICPKCGVPVSPAFVACPTCGANLRILNTKASTSIIALMYGSIVLMLIFSFAASSAHTSPADSVFRAISLILFVGSIVFGIILVCRQNMTDRIHGWSVLAIQISIFIIAMVGTSMSNSGNRTVDYNGQPYYR